MSYIETNTEKEICTQDHICIVRLVFSVAYYPHKVIRKEVVYNPIHLKENSVFILIPFSIEFPYPNQQDRHKHHSRHSDHH